MGVLSAISKAAKAFKDDITTPEEYKIGEAFQQLTEKLFLEEEFDLKSKTHTYKNNEGRYVKDSMNPDLSFIHKKSNHIIHIECKYRSNLFRDKYEWSKPWQMERYKEFQEKNRPQKTYIIMGLSGSPEQPERMFAVPLDDIKYSGLFPSFLKEYERPPNKPFTYNNGKLF
jgi:hypothetical protein